MSKTKWVLTGALFALAVFAVVLAPTSALAAKKNMVKFKGYITALGTDTVKIKDTESGDEVTVTVDNNTRIHKNNVEGASIDDLELGDKATAKYNADTIAKVAKRIQAKSPKAHGEISAIGSADANGNTPVTIENADGVLVIVLVTADTKLKLNDEPAILTDLQIGQQAKAKYDPLTTFAVHIHAWSE